MIIRRRHTANYTTIGNVLFEDERLEADEVGILAFLLSRPHDWEVRRPALMRRWKVGRDTIKRVMTNLIRTGWCRARKIRLSNGTFQVIYEIRDEPGRELSEVETREALSVESTGPVAGEAEGEDDEPDHMPGTDPPPTGQPGVANQGVAAPPLAIEELQTTGSPRTESTQLAGGFLTMRAIWPSEHVLSYVACENLHVGLTEARQEAAVSSAKAYLAECASKSRKVCDLATYYREMRWERFAARAAAAPRFAAIQRNTPQAFRWRDYFARMEPHKIASFDRQMAERGVYTAASEWPPAMPALASDS